MNELEIASDKAHTENPPKRGVRSPADKESNPFVDGIPAGSVVEIPLEEIDLENTALEFRVDQKIKDLVDDLKRNGQQFPVVLRRQEDGRFQLVSGFRRCRSIRALKWPTVKAIVRDDLDDDMAFRVSFLENEKRRSLTGKDKANAMAKLRLLGKTDTDIQDIFGIGKRQVQRYKKLTTFPDVLIRAIGDEAIRTTHALELMRVQEVHGEKVDLAHWVERVFQKDMSVRKLVQELNAHFGKPRVKKRYMERCGAGGFRLFPMRFDPKKTDDTTRQTMRKRLQVAIRLLDEAERSGQADRAAR